MKNIVIPDRITLPDVEQEVFGSDYSIYSPCVTDSSDISDDTWSTADGILAWHDLTYTRELVEQLDRCRVLVRVGVGYDNVDLSATKDRGIVVCTVPDYGTCDVADHAIGLLLSIQRGLFAYNDLTKTEGNWDWSLAGKLQRISGSNLGIIGLGRIGMAVAMRALAFGMNVSFYDPYVRDGFDKSLGITRSTELEIILNESDAITIHTPLTDETRSMINLQTIELMKTGSVLVNTARGGIVDIDALHKGLETNHIRAAGIDVLDIEPPDFTHPMIAAWANDEPWIRNRLIITPHAAFFCQGAYTEMRQKAALEAKRVLEGGSPRNPVD